MSVDEIAVDSVESFAANTVSAVVAGIGFADTAAEAFGDPIFLNEILAAVAPATMVFGCRLNHCPTVENICA